mmetsp:Transcript_19571/g.68035  ORF Transcript_19571/g.68035 Transcript_19571/m.68035 type:complete len:354 (+) Transcript_19571:1506-2567(+)
MAFQALGWASTQVPTTILGQSVAGEADAHLSPKHCGVQATLVQGGLPIIADAREDRPRLHSITICEEGPQCRLTVSRRANRIHQDEAEADPHDDLLHIGHVARLSSGTINRAGTVRRGEEVADAMLRCADSMGLWARAKRHARAAMQTPQVLDGLIRGSLELPYDQCLMKPASRTADFQIGIAGQPSRGVVGRAAGRCGSDENPSPEQVQASTQGLCKAEEEAAGQHRQILNKKHTTSRHQTGQVLQRGLCLIFLQATQVPVHDHDVVCRVVFGQVPTHDLREIFGDRRRRSLPAGAHEEGDGAAGTPCDDRQICLRAAFAAHDQHTSPSSEVLLPRRRTQGLASANSATGWK